MNDRTGEIREMSAEEAETLNKLASMNSQLQRLGAWVPIPPDQLNEVQGMNRSQRRAWAKQQRKGGKR